MNTYKADGITRTELRSGEIGFDDAVKDVRAIIGEDLIKELRINLSDIATMAYHYRVLVNSKIGKCDAYGNVID